MGCKIPEYEKGNTADLRAEIEDENGSIVSPDTSNGDYEIFITITDLDTDSAIVEEERMETVSAQEFRYPWDTSDVELGEYKVEVKAYSEGEKYTNPDRVKVVDFIDRPQSME